MIKKHLILFSILILALFINITYADYICVPKPIDALLVCPERVRIGEEFSVILKSSALSQNAYIRSKIIDMKNNYIVQDGIIGIYSQKQGGFVFNFDGINNSGSYKIIVTFNHPATGEKIEKECNFSILQKLNVVVGMKNNIVFINDDIILDVKVTPNIASVSLSIETYFNDKRVNLAYSVVEKGSNNFEIIIKKNQIQTAGELSVKVKAVDTLNKYEEGEAWKFGILLIEPQIEVKLTFPVSAKAGESKTLKIVTTDSKGENIDVDSIKMRITFPSGGGETYYKKDFTNLKTGVYEMTYTFKYGQNYYFEIIANKDGFKSGRAETNVAVSGGEVCGCNRNEDVCDEGCTCDPLCQETKIPIFPIILIVSIILLFLILKFVIK